MRHLTYIMSLAITLLMVACYPEGNDSSIMGPGEKVVGAWFEADIPTDTPFYIFHSDGTYASGITNLDPDSPSSQQQSTSSNEQQGEWIIEEQGTWYVLTEGLLTITPENTPSQTYDYYADRDHLEFDGRDYRRVAISLHFDPAWSDTLHYQIHNP